MAEFRDVLHANTPTHSRLRDTVTAIAAVSVAVDLICAVLAFVLERHAAKTEIDSFGSAIFWTSTQLLTVSSQIQNPISVGGRILDVFMEAYAISVVATLAGSMGAFLIRRGHEIEQAAAAAAAGGRPPAAAGGRAPGGASGRPAGGASGRPPASPGGPST
jgi:hypothetical protein